MQCQTGRRPEDEGQDRAALLAVGVISAVVAGGVVAATQSSDEAALQPARGSAASQNVERRVDTLLRQMTLQEKLNQIQLISDGQINETPRRPRSRSAACSASPTRS